MKLLIIIILYFPTLTIKGQGKYDSIKYKYYKTSKTYDSIGLKNTNVDFLESALKEFRPNYSKLLQLDDLKNKILQKALLKNYSDKYLEAFNFIVQNLGKQKFLYGFDNKEDILNYIEFTEAFFMAKIGYLKNEIIYKFFEDVIENNENYINSNLKRLGVSRKEFDELSESDKNLLIEQFKE